MIRIKICWFEKLHGAHASCFTQQHLQLFFFFCVIPRFPVSPHSGSETCGVES